MICSQYTRPQTLPESDFELNVTFLLILLSRHAVILIIDYSGGIVHFGISTSLSCYLHVCLRCRVYLIYFLALHSWTWRHVTLSKNRLFILGVLYHLSGHSTGWPRPTRACTWCGQALFIGRPWLRCWYGQVINDTASGQTVRLRDYMTVVRRGQDTHSVHTLSCSLFWMNVSCLDERTRRLTSQFTLRIHCLLRVRCITAVMNPWANTREQPLQECHIWRCQGLVMSGCMWPVSVCGRICLNRDRGICGNKRPTRSRNVL